MAIDIERSTPSDAIVTRENSPGEIATKAARAADVFDMESKL
jgi:hypothetical protein